MTVEELHKCVTFVFKCYYFVSFSCSVLELKNVPTQDTFARDIRRCVKFDFLNRILRHI